MNRDAPSLSAFETRSPASRALSGTDHFIPCSVVGEPDKVLAKLELMSYRMNEGENDKLGSRQRSLAKQLRGAGQSSGEGLNQVERRRPHVPQVSCTVAEVGGAHLGAGIRRHDTAWGTEADGVGGKAHQGSFSQFQFGRIGSVPAGD